MSCPHFVAVLNSNHGGAFLSCPWEMLGVFCSPHQKAGMGMELSLHWPERRGAPSKLSSGFLLLSSFASPYMGSPFPLGTRPYSNPRGLRLLQHLCNEASIPHCSGGAAELASAWTWSHHPSTSPLSPPQLSALSPCCPRAWPWGESCFRGVKPFYFINCSTKPS